MMDMVRRWTLLWGILAGLIPASTFSLGLGDIVVRSNLNQPLSAEIPLLSARPEDVENATVQIASNEDFKRQGLDRPSFLSQLHFEALRKRDGTPYIRITSTQAIREPFVDFLLDIDWAKGRLQRRYTLLLDPPGHKVQTEIAAAPRRIAEPRPRRQAQPSEAPAPEGPASEGIAQRGESSYGPIRRRDTLWSIALRLRPNSSVSIYQTMLALFKANPQAFDKDNMNSLKAGQVLQVPSAEEMASVSHEDAFQDVRRQTRAWRESGRRVAQAPAGRLASSAKPAPEKGTSKAPGKAPAEAASEQMRLKLVSPAAGQPGGAGQAAPGQAPAPTEQDLSALREELAVTSQELGSKRQENEQLRARVTQLESMVGSMERMITLKGDELAQLQNRLSALEKGQPAAKPAPTPQAPGEVSASAPSPAASAPATRSVRESESKPASAVKPAERAPVEKRATEKTGAARVAVRGLEFESLLDSVLSNPLLLGTGVAAVLLLLTGLWWISRKRGRRDMATYMPSFEPSLEQEGFEEDQEAAAPAQMTTGVGSKRPAATSQRAGQEVFPSGLVPAAAATATAGITAVSAEPGEPQAEVPLFADLPDDLDIADTPAGMDALAPDSSASVTLEPVSPAHQFRKQAKSADITISEEEPTAKLAQPGPLEVGEVVGSKIAEYQTAKLIQPEPFEGDFSLGSESAPAHAVQESAIFEWHWPEPAGGSAAPETASANEAGDLSDFTLSLGPEQQPAPEAMAGLWNETAAPAAQDAAVRPTPSEDEALEGSSAVQTKLDLAKVYIDLGVFEDAGSLLQEVKELGDDIQKQEAEELLKKIA